MSETPHQALSFAGQFGECVPPESERGGVRSDKVKHLYRFEPPCRRE